MSGMRKEANGETPQGRIGRSSPGSYSRSARATRVPAPALPVVPLAAGSSVCSTLLVFASCGVYRFCQSPTARAHPPPTRTLIYTSRFPMNLIVPTGTTCPPTLARRAGPAAVDVAGLSVCSAWAARSARPSAAIPAVATASSKQKSR